jgi:hypothetical protein
MVPFSARIISGGIFKGDFNERNAVVTRVCTYAPPAQPVLTADFCPGAGVESNPEWRDARMHRKSCCSYGGLCVLLGNSCLLVTDTSH